MVLVCFVWFIFFAISREFHCLDKTRDVGFISLEIRYILPCMWMLLFIYNNRRGMELRKSIKRKKNKDVKVTAWGKRGHGAVDSEKIHLSPPEDSSSLNEWKRRSLSRPYRRRNKISTDMVRSLRGPRCCTIHNALACVPARIKDKSVEEKSIIITVVRSPPVSAWLCVLAWIFSLFYFNTRDTRHKCRLFVAEDIITRLTGLMPSEVQPVYKDSRFTRHRARTSI